MQTQTGKCLPGIKQGERQIDEERMKFAAAIIFR